MNEATTAIKTMKLYTHVERIDNELRALGRAPDAPLAVSELTPFDQLHYEGTVAVDRAARELGINATSKVIEIGSGLGGPARHLAATTGCRITAVELQPDLDACARQLTQRCGLADRVMHLCGDALTCALPHRSFDALVSWLAFLHIPDRVALLARCRAVLDDHGAMYIEDFCRRGVITAAERLDLSQRVYCSYLPDSGEYRDQIRAAGFASTEIVDMTAPWTEFVAERRQRFAAGRARYVAVHGETAFSALDEFYDTVQRLFAGGNVGGVRIVARVTGRPPTGENRAP